MDAYEGFVKYEVLCTALLPGDGIVVSGWFVPVWRPCALWAEAALVKSGILRTVLNETPRARKLDMDNVGAVAALVCEIELPPHGSDVQSRSSHVCAFETLAVAVGCGCHRRACSERYGSQKNSCNHRAQFNHKSTHYTPFICYVGV